ncbi:MAG: ATP-binding cassette domain-containing protein [Sphaerobacteraceae bacterium]|nr:MAG: ATP-binding cassette domain-containing protein [Sphaerobacteraceae bacterium]
MLDSRILSVQSLGKAITLHLLGEKQVQALDDVTFDVSDGEFVAVVGLSGSGKSSLLKCLYRTYLATAGSILYQASTGQDIDLASASEQDILKLRRNEIRYVPQFLKSAPRLSALDIVARPLVESGYDADIAYSEASRILSELGIGSDLQSSFPSLFSGGEQQRVNVARAVVAPSRLMLLDEPTSALDAENRERVFHQLQKVKDGGSTIIGVFHDRWLLRHLADRVVVMEHGKVAQIGTRDEVAIARYVGAETVPAS